jgi:hypothetical protein
LRPAFAAYYVTITVDPTAAISESNGGTAPVDRLKLKVKFTAKAILRRGFEPHFFPILKPTP